MNNFDDDLPCITCEKSLRLTGKPVKLAGRDSVVCKSCGATYRITSMQDENGVTQTDEMGRPHLYLDPVSPGNLAEGYVGAKRKLSKLVRIIKKARTPVELVVALKGM